MANWAIVIGVDQYWTPEACLRGAVHDALAMRAWLEESRGGAVPPQNLILLLSPAAASPAIPAGAAPATRDNIVLALDDLVQRSGGRGERLFFYFSGHGVTSRENFSSENSIVPTDFTDRLTTKALTLRSIFEFFQGTQLQEQFFFIDACRNIPWARDEREFFVGRVDVPVRPVPPVPPQYVMYATAQLLRALELREPGNERSAFTAALLQGLQGAGRSKRWDYAREEYVLRWPDLFAYVEEAVGRLKLAAGGAAAEPFIQLPRQAGEHGAEPPVLARFDAQRFADETLAVDLDPGAAAPSAELTVRDMGEIVREAGNFLQLPVEFTLPPRTYSVRARAPSYQAERKSYLVDLYEAQTVSIRLIQGQAVPPPAPTLPPGTPAAAPAGSIAVSCPDRLARLELWDGGGRRLAAGEGRLQLDNLAPGLYTARLATPEGTFAEQRCELLPGAVEEITLGAPALPASPLLHTVLDKSRIWVSPDNLIFPAEAIGPMANARLSTLLALAGGAANDPSGQGGYHLRQLGLRSFQEAVQEAAASGVQVLFGVDAAGDAAVDRYLAATQLRLWRQGDDPPAAAEQPAPVTDAPGLADKAWASEPGAYWLSIATPEQRPAAFALAVLPRRLTLVVVYRDPSGEVAINQYMPVLEPSDSFDAQTAGDPRAQGEQFPILQRSELIQRAYAAGQLDVSSENAQLLLYAKWFEPVAGCLGGYMMLQTDPGSDLLSVAVGNLTRHFGALSDSHVLHAAWLEQRGAGGAADAYRAALDAGIPILQESLVRLYEGLQRRRIEHARMHLVSQIYTQRVRGLLWTAVPLVEPAPGGRAAGGALVEPEANASGQLAALAAALAPKEGGRVVIGEDWVEIDGLRVGRNKAEPGSAAGSAGAPDQPQP